MTPYAEVAARLRSAGHSVIPIAPGLKTPGRWSGGHWTGLPGWQRYCDAPAPEFQHEMWERWPDAGVGIAHGRVVAIDVDCDDAAISEAAMQGAGPSPVRRRGRKGFAAYYAAGEGLADLPARVRWYRPANERPAVELLLHGTQTVLPPSVHPDTGQPYRWLTLDTLETHGPEDLPVLDAAGFARLDAALLVAGLVRAAPSRKNGPPDYDAKRVVHQPGGHDLEKAWGRSLNDRALEPDALDRWWPALGLPKTVNRGRGCWSAVAHWRPSGSGRPLSERNPNLRASPLGIRDYGEERGYTPLDVVLAARGGTIPEAARWLEQFVRPEEGAEPMLLRLPEAAAPESEEPAASGEDWGPLVTVGAASGREQAAPVPRPTRAEFEALIAEAAFPVHASGLRGLLGETVRYIEAAAVVRSEAGGIAAALPMLGCLMGRAWASPTDLRTALYCIGIGPSGSGKTALVAPLKSMMARAGATQMIGADRIASGSGLIKMLAGQAPKVCFLDEFGHMLQQLGRPGAGVHAAQVLTELTRLYSAANQLYTGTAYSMTPTEAIDCPHLCVFGQSTPDQFWRGFASTGLEDGSAARFLVLPLGETTPQEPDDRFAEELADGLRALIAHRPDRRPGALNPPALRVPMTAGAERAVGLLKRRETAFALYAEEAAVKGAGPILRRFVENTIRIALVSAVGRNPAEPVIDEGDVDVGHAVAWWSASVMIRNIATHVADNQIERDVNDVERAIKAAGPQGISRGVLNDRLRRIRKREIAEIVELLLEAGTIIAMRGGITKPLVVYTHKDHAPDHGD